MSSMDFSQALTQALLDAFKQADDGTLTPPARDPVRTGFVCLLKLDLVEITFERMKDVPG